MSTLSCHFSSRRFGGGGFPVSFYANATLSSLYYGIQLIPVIPPRPAVPPLTPPPTQHLERTVQDARKQKQAALQQFGTSGPTPEESIDDMDTSLEEEDEGDDDSSGGGAGGGYNRREAVMRASLLRCASDLIEKGPFRRATLEVSDPAAQKALRDAAVCGGAPPPAPGPSGPDPLAPRPSEETAGSAGATQMAVDGWKSIPPQVEEEPHPWGRGEHMVTAATAVQKLVQ